MSFVRRPLPLVSKWRAASYDPFKNKLDLVIVIYNTNITDAMSTTTTTPTTKQRGGARPAPVHIKLAKLRKLKAFLAAGYGMEVASKRAKVTSVTARAWAAELGFNL